MDSSNKAFWENISSNFQQAIELLYKTAKEQGIDLDKVMTDDEIRKYHDRERGQRAAIEKHILSSICKQYQQTARSFLEKTHFFTDRTTEIANQAELGIGSREEALSVVTGIGDCFEVIHWYLFFMDAKLQRALHGKMEGEEWEEDIGYQKDSDGSAKVALLSIDRSIEAWVKLYSLLPASEDTALISLSLLEQLKRKTIEEFPQALNFKRAGFDDAGPHPLPPSP